MKWKYAAVLTSFLMVATAFAVVASAEDDAPSVPKMSNLENYLIAKAELDRLESEGVVPTTLDTDSLSYTDGPYPHIDDDGSPPGPEHTPWGDHYVSDVMYAPPNNPGGWFSTDATGGSGEYSVGDTHEYYIGDQNGNGNLEWVTGYSFAPWGEDGIDNDGDGCVDEKTYGDWDGQVGCDLIPDQTRYFETGGLPDAGGDDGTLMTLVDWYSSIQATEIWRAGVTPAWMAYQLRGFTNYPQMAGDFISYYAYEGTNGVNANPEMDSDQTDYYVGNIDARGFPGRAPVDQACSAGWRLYMGITFLRDDGWVVTSYELREYYDGQDWNGDGDTSDRVAAYYAIDPITGNCRQNTVNTGVYGEYPRNTGVLLTPGTTREVYDERDWDQSGSVSGYMQLYHDIESTWSMKGHVYTSFTFTASVPAWGFGWWALYNNYYQFQTFPLKFGSVYYRNLGSSQGYYHTYYSVVGDDDGNRHTMLPQYHLAVGQPSATPGGECIQIYTREYNARLAGIVLMGTSADANGDGDTTDTYNTVFCPEGTGGGGSWLVEPTSKFAKGFYTNSIPVINLGFVYYSSDGTTSGLVVMPYFFEESSQHDDADGDLSVGYTWFHTYYWLQLTKPDFEFGPGSLDWIFTGDVQPGGTVIGTFDLLNIGETNIKIKEDSGIEVDKGFKLQGLSARDRIGPDGIIEPQETARFVFALTVPAGAPIGPLTMKIVVTYGGVTKGSTMTLPIILKMFGDDQSCYRHRQNALRTIRAFDMDDDEGMLHNLEPGDLVLLDGATMTPEDAVLLLLSFYEGGCQANGHNDVEHAHSASSGLTGHYGMGMEYWGFAPGQEEGNEGNGNGGLTGRDRKDVYGF
ncbi:MAG: hypothetical protein JSV43_00425 [Methanobacteriota archaeon]|nr:MAG: hypothetical protein JSV43_00425 [Euryarchaeota archaeon]